MRQRTDKQDEKEEVKMDSIKSKGLFLFIALAIMIHLFSVEARAEKRIGVLLWSEETRYNEAKNGIMDELKKDGFGEPAVKYTIENARGSKAKVVEIVQQFAAVKMDLIITLGTSATIPAARAINDVPIVFCLVFDPIEAGIAKDWKSSGNNTTGVSGRVPMSKLVDYLKEFAPVKRLMVLYTPGEKNSESQLVELKNIQASSKIKVIPIILTKKEEVVHTLSGIVYTADAIFLTGSNIVGVSVHQIVGIANKAKLVTIAFLDDLIEKGTLLGICANPYLLGRLAGNKAGKILKGAKPSSIPIEYLKEYDVVINMKTAKAGKFQIPTDFMKKVTRTIE